jgi:hypothetical protein
MVYAAQAESSSFIAAAKDTLPPELVSPAVAFLALESCPVTGECIESMGGHINRFYLARTPGFTDPAMTIETIVERWADVVAGTAEKILLHTEADPRAWSPKPYVPAA